MPTALSIFAALALLTAPCAHKPRLASMLDEGLSLCVAVPGISAAVATLPPAQMDSAAVAARAEFRHAREMLVSVTPERARITVLSRSGGLYGP